MSDATPDYHSSLQFAAITDVGMRRANNQDSHRVVVADDEATWLDRGHVFMVADGMGAHAAGELASKLACDGIPHLYNKYREKSPPEALEQSILETNAEVHRRGQANPDFHNMGTTTSVLALLPQGAICGHIGDSRIYRLRQDRLEQLTFDHSLIWELQAAGQIPDGAEVSGAIPKNVITRSLGPNANVQVDIEGPFSVEVDDVFLLCSDGLTGLVEDPELASILANMSPHEAAQVLVDLANLRGGPDNITVIIAKAIGPGIATQAGSAKPLQIGGKKVTPKVHPAIWITLGVCVLAAIVMLILGELIPALVAAVGGIVAAIVGLVQRSARGVDGLQLSDQRRLGKGPYTNTPAETSEAFVQSLAEIVADLRSAATENDWIVNWEPFDQLCDQATQSADNGKFSESVQHYARGISFMMQQLRSQNERKASDSSVEL